jgi:hypothetical protein
LRQILWGIACVLLLGGQASAAMLRVPEASPSSVPVPATAMSVMAPLSGTWSLRGGLELEPSGALTPAFAVQRHGLIAGEDMLSFTISQPDRKTPFAAIWILGIDPERSSRDLLLVQSERLVPTARELAMRGAYRTRLGNWVGGFTLGYSFNAGQVAGRNAVRSTVSLTRAF